MSGKISTMNEFLGKKVLFFFVGSFVLGFLIYAAEMLFAFSIVGFLTKLGLIQNTLPEGVKFLENQTLSIAIYFLIGATLFRAVTWWAMQYFGGALEQSFRYVQRMRMTDALMSDRLVSTGDSMALYGEKTNSAGSVVVAAQTILLHSLLTVAYIFTLLAMSFKVTLITTASLLVVLYPILWIYQRVKDRGDRVTSEWREVNKYLMLTFQNIFFLKVYGMLKVTRESSEKNLTGFFDNHLKFYQVQATAMVAPQFLGIIILVAASYFGHKYMLLDKALLVPYFYIFLRFTQSGSTAAGKLSEVIFKWPQLKEILEWWKNDKILAQRSKKFKIQKVENKDVVLSAALAWSVEQMSFQYEGEAAMVLNQFSLQIAPGEAVVFSGPSGSGKSTLLSLLIGILEPTQGTVKIKTGSHEYDAAEIRESLWSQIGYVGADSYLLPATVIENLKFGLKRDVTLEEINEALEMAGCHFVEDLSGQLNYFIGEGGEGLSTGQRQRLGLARAMLRKPKALVLDEFTANLDPEIQEHLIDSLLSLKGKCTMVIVSHRKELLRVADKHVQMNQGSILKGVDRGFNKRATSSGK